MIKFLGVKDGIYEVKKSGEVLHFDYSEFIDFVYDHIKKMKIDHRFLSSCFSAGVDILDPVCSYLGFIEDRYFVKEVKASLSYIKDVDILVKIIRCKPRAFVSFWEQNKCGLKDKLSSRQVFDLFLEIKQMTDAWFIKGVNNIFVDLEPHDWYKIAIWRPKIFLSFLEKNKFGLRDKLSPEDLASCLLSSKYLINKMNDTQLFKLVESWMSTKSSVILIRDLAECKPHIFISLLKRKELDTKTKISLLESDGVRKSLFKAIKKEFSRDYDFLLDVGIHAMPEDEFFEIIKSGDGCLNFYNKNKERLSTIEQYLFLDKMSKYDKHAIKIMESLKLSSGQKAIMKRIKGFKQDEPELIFPSWFHIELFEPGVIDLLGEENVFNIIRYNNDGYLQVKKLIADPATFKKYYEFRQKNLPQDNLQPKNIIDALDEFDRHYNLIKDCMDGELTQKEKAILVRAVTEQFTLEGKDDLKNFTTKRTEYFKGLIHSSSDEEDTASILNYIFTKFSAPGYAPGSLLPDQLEIILNDFPEFAEQVEFCNITSLFRKMLLEASEEERNKYLDILIADLENEFSPQGSMLASLRNNFTAFANEVRAKYGEELKNSLSDSFGKLPESKKVGEVDVINLDKPEKKFKLLIHGLNAYGKGGGKGWTHMENGKAYLCTSLISDNHLKRAKANIYYGFSDISNTSLALEGSSDIWSEAAHDNPLDIEARGDAVFQKTDELLNNTQSDRYNEVVLYRESFDENGGATPITPDYIVAFDKISQFDKREAIRLNIPIIFIDTKVYDRQHDNEEEIEKDQIEVSEKTDTKSLKEYSSIDEIMQIITTADKMVDAREQKEVIKEINEAMAYETTKNDEVGHSQ